MVTAPHTWELKKLLRKGFEMRIQVQIKNQLDVVVYMSKVFDQAEFESENIEEILHGAYTERTCTSVMIPDVNGNQCHIPTSWILTNLVTIVRSSPTN